MEMRCFCWGNFGGVFFRGMDFLEVVIGIFFYIVYFIVGFFVRFMIYGIKI